MPDLLDPVAGLDEIAGLLDLDLLDLEDLQIAELLQDLLGFLPGLDSDDPVEALAALLNALAGSPGDLGPVSGLLETLLDGQGLIQDVVNILNLSMVEDLLGNLGEEDLLGLLGLLDTGSSAFQNVKLLFTTGATAPGGNLKVRLKASAPLAVASVEYDNVVIRRFDIVPTPDGGGPGDGGPGDGGPGDGGPGDGGPGDGGPGDGGPGAGAEAGDPRRPLVRPDRQRVIRKTTRPQVVIRGVASAFGEGNSVEKVQVAVRGSGTRPAERKYRDRVAGTGRWVARVPVPVSARTRVLFRSIDQLDRVSITSFVRVNRR